MKYLTLRRHIVETALRMNREGLSPGRSGNLGARAGTGFLVTPSGLPYDEMGPGDIVAMSFDGTLADPAAGTPAGPSAGTTPADPSAGTPARPPAGAHLPSSARLPSSEWRIHRDILAARPEVGAVIHAHAMFATTLACLRRDIPPFHYMIAVAGGASIRCAPYATFGTEALSRNALAALEGRRACLLANHGMIALGATLDEAFDLAREVETLAQQYWRALVAGEPVLLTAAEMAEAIERFKTYGRGAGAGAPARSGNPARPARPEGPGK